MGKWKKRAKLRAETIENMRREIYGQQAEVRTLRTMLDIAKKDALDARIWAEAAERATARIDGTVSG